MHRPLLLNLLKLNDERFGSACMECPIHCTAPNLSTEPKMKTGFLSSMLLLGGLAACGALQVSEDLSVSGPIRHVQVRWTSGNVRIHADGTDGVELASRVWGPEALRSFRHHVEGDALVLDLTCDLPAPCGGNLDLHVLPGTRIDVDLGDGRVVLDGQGGDLAVIVGRGAIEAEGLTASTAVLQVGQGDVKAEWDRAPQRVIVATAQGDAHLLVPPDQYRVEDPANGTVVRGLEPDADAGRTLRVTTPGGRGVLEAVVRPPDSRV